MALRSKRLIRRVICLLLMVFSCVPIYSVSSESLRSVYTVTNTQSSGAGSLRQAILDANTYAGKDYIYFNIPESDSGYSEPLGVWFINLTIVLPMLEDPNGVVIDGSTQLGSHAYLPGIIIDASALTAGTEIFTIISDSNEITHLGLMSSQGNSIEVDSDADYNVISENQIFNSEGHGIFLHAGDDYSSIIDNRICGHKGDGIHIEESTNAFISGNVVGIQPLYMPSVLNNEGNGLSCLACTNSTIQDNTISGNLGNGVYFSDSDNNLLEDNRIGLSEDGLTAIGNNTYGILLENNSSGNDIFENWISGNSQDGIRLTGSGISDNHVEGNKIGLGLGGSLPNGWHGVGIYDDAHNNHVGNLSDPSRYNIIVSNGWSGVVVVNSASGSNYIVDNYILYNQYYGVHINNSFDNFIGSNTISGNGIAGTYAGVRIEGSTSLSNAITMNSIYQNTGLGIQLVSGGNAEIDAPVITSATCSTVTGTTCSNCSVQIYSDNEDEGRVFETLTNANSSGDFAFTDFTGFTGPYFTAIAFDTAGNASQFSAPLGGCFRSNFPVIKK